MPPDMPTDIQRLIRRMLEARTDKAEDVIPDMASGGILGLQNGGVIGEEDPLSSRQQMILDMMVNQGRERQRERRDPGDVIYDIGREIDQWSLDNQYIPSERELEERFAPRPQWPTPSIPKTDLERIRDIGGGIAGKFRGGLEALGDRLRSHVRIPGKGPNLSTDEEYLERTSPEGWPKYLDARRRRLEGRASGGIIGFQAGGSPYQQRMVQSYVSPEVAQPYADLTGRIQQVGARPYTP